MGCVRREDETKQDEMDGWEKKREREREKEVGTTREQVLSSYGRGGGSM